MESDDKLKWLEGRITSSLRTRNEDMKNMLLNDENRLAFHEFVNNEDVRRLFVFVRSPRHILASLHPPHDLSAKSIFFLKNNAGIKLSKDNMDEEVMYFDCSENALHQLDMLTREVYLPLLCTDTTHAIDYGISADKMMDMLHRLMAAVETTQGHTEGEITLSLPSIEVLAEAAANSSRRGAVLHVLETTVIGWIKQIKNILKHDAVEELSRLAGPFPGPLDEVDLWTTRLDKLRSINVQLDSPVAQDIMRNLDEANSTYAQSFLNVRRDITKAIQDTEENLRFLNTMSHWFHELHHSVESSAMLGLFAPLTHTVLLVWTHSKYYHQTEKFNNLLRLLSNEVVHRAEDIVGEDVLREPLESYSKLKDALRVCAAFRGTYLDYREKAEEINERNKQDHQEKLITRPQGPYTLFSTKLYGQSAFVPRYGLQGKTSAEEEEQMREEELWRDSPWPPRNAPAFDLLNSFMERCNDVLELVQTTRHFRLLADTAEIGGAGSQNLDAMVREIHVKYSQSMEDFFSQVANVLSIDGSQTFEKAFFTFRTIVKDLERKLSEVLRQSFHQCPTIDSQLRLLEVFEGISSRELVQAHLKDKDQQLVTAFTKELIQVRSMFKENERSPPHHQNMPPVVSNMLWIFALKQRVQTPMKKMKTVSPHSLEGDLGWQLRDAYSEVIQDIEKYETRVITEWQNGISTELTERLKQPVLLAEEYDEDVDVRPQSIVVNLDSHLLLLLREIHYLSQDPFNITLPATARELLRNTHSATLRAMATRLETIVSKYNSVMRLITEFEQPLFDRCLAKIDHLFEQGLQQYTWRTEETIDFIETANALVCTDLHHNLDIVQTNCAEISQLTADWSACVLDVFAGREMTRSYDILELVDLQKKLNADLEASVVPSGHRIHSLLETSFQAVQISEASPAWQDYIDYIDAIVLDGLKQTCLSSLQSMLNQIIKSNLSEEQDLTPILTIRVELIENSVTFCPPLDQSTSYSSVHETVQQWLEAFLDRGSLVPMLSAKGTYRDFISVDEEVDHLISQINLIVQNNSDECKELFELFKDYTFLWNQDVTQTFEEFLHGNVSPNPLRDSSRQGGMVPTNLRAMASARSASRASSTKSSIESAGLVGTAEKSFLTPKTEKNEESDIPSLDEFEAEINIYMTARDEVQSLPEYQDVGWLRVDLRPIKQVLTTYASKWMWTYTKYLTDQVTTMLENLDAFLKRTEPEIEDITGEERDTASFMKMMRLFNEVSAQQHEMDGKFAAMHRTVLLVRQYGHKLPDATQQLFDAAPGRWNSLKTKVSLAKQRLGPRIQEESDRITKDLAMFGEQVDSLHKDLDASEVYSRDCTIANAWINIDNFVKRLDVLENEAQDLIELQELLEASVVNFSILPQCHHDLDHLKQVWETVRLMEDQQSEWKRHRWQKMNTKFLREETNKQLDIVKDLPEDVFTWDIYMGLYEDISTVQACLPLVDDLSNPAMRTRHWKQLVRVTGGAVQVDNDTLKRMTLGELLSLGLQKHVDDVRAIVQRAVKDLIIEQSLKTYEEVWLSKIFELREHVRNKMIANGDKGEYAGDTQSEVSHQSEVQPGMVASRSQVRSTSRISNQSSMGRTRRTSVSSLPYSLLQVGEETGFLMLLTGTDMIFDELEGHQVALQAMQSSSAAGSFLDEVVKWQKRLQTIEAVLTSWLQVQEKWVELEEVFSTQEVRTALSHDSNTFSIVNRDFNLLMKATEKNPNVLQCCQRKNILTILEKMVWNLDICKKSLVMHLEKRRLRFPRFYFLSIEDVLHIICNGYDMKQVNLYISKLFENVAGLVYEEVDNPDKFQFQVTGVRSFLGETLLFQDPVACEGHIEGWLPVFLSMVRTTLQYQLVSAVSHGTGTDKPQPQSVRASRVSTPHQQQSDRASRTSSPQQQRNISTPTQEKPNSRNSSRAGSQRSAKKDTQEPIHTENPTTEGDRAASTEGRGAPSHVTQVVHLATQIQLTKQTSEALKQYEAGTADAIQTEINNLNTTIKDTIIMLKSLKNKKEEETLEPHPSVEIDEVKTSPDLTDTANVDSASQSASHFQDEQATADQESDPQLVPSQIHKLSSLVALLTQQRELLVRLQQQFEDKNPALVSADFMWQSQLQYFYEEQKKTLKIKSLQVDFEYGYEYLGSAQREVVTPLTEKVFFGLIQALKHFTGGLCVGQSGEALPVLHELSHCLGRPLYVFNCTQKTNTNFLYDIFKGFSTTGCWICFNNVNHIPVSVLSTLSQLLSTVMDALHSGRGSLHLQAEELILNPDVACFATLSSAIKVEPTNPEKHLLFNSAVARLPEDFTKQFRIISLLKPDLKLIVEVLLLSQGFLFSADLSRKTICLYEICHQMIGTNTPVVNGVSHMFYNCMDLTNGWSLKTLRCVTEEAGVILHNSQEKTNDSEMTQMEEKQVHMENEAMVLALRNTFMPRLNNRDASVFGQLIKDLWPDVTVPLSFGGLTMSRSQLSEADEKSVISGHANSKPGSRLKSRSQMDPSQPKSYRDSLNLNTPVVQVPSALSDNLLPQAEHDKQSIENIDDAIAVATSDLGLMPGVTFQARVSQLSQLNTVHKIIVVAGPAGCGKSECIKTYAIAERERGKTVDIQSIFTRAYESEELLGCLNPQTKIWKDGLLPCVLRKVLIQSDEADITTDTKPLIKVVQLDGEFDSHQLELVEAIFSSSRSVVFGNNERMVIPDALRFIWETDSLSSLSPSLLANVGVLAMTSEDVGWAMLLANWLDQRTDSDQDLLKTLCHQYIASVIHYLENVTKPVFSTSETSGVHMKQMIWQSEKSMIMTFTTILDAMLTQFPDLNDTEVERMFNVAAVWAFGGTLVMDHRELFSHWWQQAFGKYVEFPEDGTVFDYMVDPESHLFVKWADSVPAYSSTAHNNGIPPDAFVHSVNSEQLLYFLGILTDYGKPVMLVGENSCGKTSIVSERMRSVCSGEVAEVLGLTITASRFTNAKLLYDRLDDLLEWKHGKTYVPRGNKRLMCFIDDLNLSQTDEYHKQTATELIRQHIDDGGFYNNQDHSWRYVTNVTYVTTLNPQPTASVPALNPRLLRHFAVFGCPYPSHSEQQSIFSTLLHAHFITPDLTSAVTSVERSTAHHLGMQDDKVQNEVKEEEEALKKLLTLIVHVTLEVQDKLRSMFLPTAGRCHYLFSMRDVSTLFRNICLSLRPACNRDSLLLLWEHECYWLFGHRMINEVDYNRFRQTYLRDIRKNFYSEDQIQLLSNKEKPIFSNLVEQDSGLVTAGNIFGNLNCSDSEASTDLYRAEYQVSTVKELMERGVEEYNKTHPRIKVALYKMVIEQVCRLARVIASPHEVSHCVLVSEGGAGHTPVLVNLAAHLCGFSVFKINPSPISSNSEYKMDAFRADIVSAYTRAGVKGEKVIFQLEDDELVQEDFLVYLSEFIVSGSISHLFSPEEQTTIINSIRTEVTQAGLAYTRDVAWDFFLKTVKKNFRICYICSEGSTNFQRRCREYPNFTKNVNFLWCGHWTKRQLIKHAAFHLKKLTWMTKIQKENVAYMLATMHLVTRQQDGQEQGTGEYRHLTNLTYEKFIERFISMASAHHSSIHSTHQNMMQLMLHIQRENALATKLKHELEHERVVLRERKEGTVKILAQIGQDTAITEQQIKIVRAQMDKIHTLKKLLPEYQVAHERAVYKTVSIVADTKKIVQNINLDSMSELRTMQKPIIDIEDLMAAIIMILKKNPQADLTWQKGAKRQMANLERFIEELLTFDEEVLPEATLVLVEPYLKKSSFDPEALEKKTNNVACGSLCRWVKGVCRYHRMMISKVKPLHNKVEETTTAIDNAEHKMNLLENKRKGLEVRLADLAKAFEEATIDKNEQEEKTKKMDKMLETAARLKKVLRREQSRIQQIIDSLPQREESIFGGVAMASALSSYLGPYHYNFRRLMLTVHWPNCLRERGVPLVIDRIDELKGRVVDWSIDGLKTAAGASSSGFVLDAIEEADEPDEEEDNQAITQETENDKDTQDGELANDLEENSKDVGTEKDQNETMEKETSREPSPEEDFDEESKPVSPKTPEEQKNKADIEESNSELKDSQDSLDSLPVVTGEQYNVYMRSLIKLIVGEEVLQDWLKRDISSRQMENASILFSSWQRPPMLIDPYGDGVKNLKWLNSQINKRDFASLDMATRSDPQVILGIEKGIMEGWPVLLENCTDHMDTLITPIIQHRNTALEHEEKNGEPRMIKYCSRRVLCHHDFRLYMTTRLPKPSFSPSLASTMTLVNYGSSNDTILEEVLTRAFARIRPEMYRERRLALKNIHINSDGLMRLWAQFKGHLQQSAQNRQILFDEKDVDVVSDMTKKTVLIAQRVQDGQKLLNDLDLLREELYPLARRAAKLYALLRSLAAIQREYQFPLPYFYQLFDDAVGGEFPPEYSEIHEGVENHKEENSKVDEAEKRSTTPNQHKDEEQKQTEDYADDFDGDDNDNRLNDHEETPPDTEEKDEENLHLFDLPEVQQLPSDGVDYTGLGQNRIQEMVDSLTKYVFEQVQNSLFEEDRLLFAALLCLFIQEEAEVFSEEEMSLLLQGNPGLGMQLSLSDFDCNEDAPSWLPSEKWEDILAISVLPGPLDSLCVQIAENSKLWKDWYKSDKPETLDVPIHAEDEQEKGHTENGKSTPNLGPLTDFHQLIVLRLMRPDRLPLAMEHYVSRHFMLDTGKPSCLTVGQVLDTGMCGDCVGVLVLTPPSPSSTSDHRVSSLGDTRSSASYIQALAQERNIKIDCVTIGNGMETSVIDIMDSVERDNHWAVIQNLHLATSQFMMEVAAKLQRMARRRDPNKQDAKFCLWFTSEPCDSIPMDLLNLLNKLSWDALPRLMTDTAPPGPGQAGPGQAESGQKENSEATLKFSCGSLTDALAIATASAFRSVEKTVWDRASALPPHLKRVGYALGIVHGILATRQMLGTRGLSQYTPVSTSLYAQILDNLVVMVKELGEDELSADTVCHILSADFYSQVVFTVWDKQYVTAMVYQVLSLITQAEEATVQIGSLQIPVPPTNLEPADYLSWYEENVSADTQSTLEGLSLHGNVDREFNDALGVKFLQTIEHVYQAQNMTLGEIQPSSHIHTSDMIRLRTILDNITEKLPPLLELGTIPKDLLRPEYNFPYHRPSVISMASTESVMMPESIGFVLLQECLWQNSILCHIRQNIHEIHQCLLSGPESFPWELRPMVQSVLEEHVPASWLHPNCQPSTHSLTSWLADLQKRHTQMHDWVKHRMIPVYQEGCQVGESRGVLQSVWLGGLVNPQALLTALRQEKAILLGCPYDKVSLEVDVSQAREEDSHNINQEATLHLLDLHVQGAEWNKDKNCLVTSCKDVNVLPDMVIRFVNEDDRKSVRADLPSGIVEYRCPVFMNKARQVCSFSLDLNCTAAVQEWTAAGTALLLDTGVPEDVPKKCRSFMIPKAGTITSARSHGSGSISDSHRSSEWSAEEEGDDDFSFEEADEDIYTQRSEDPSQLSYKPMSPQATPLPPELMMTRERPVAAAQDEVSKTSPQADTVSGGRDTVSGGQGNNPPSEGKPQSHKSVSRSSSQRSSFDSATQDKNSAIHSEKGDSNSPRDNVRSSGSDLRGEKEADTYSYHSQRQVIDHAGSRTSLSKTNTESDRDQQHMDRDDQQTRYSPSDSPKGSVRGGEQTRYSPTDSPKGSVRGGEQTRYSPSDSPKGSVRGGEQTRYSPSDSPKGSVRGSESPADHHSDRDSVSTTSVKSSKSSSKNNGNGQNGDDQKRGPDNEEAAEDPKTSRTSDNLSVHGTDRDDNYPDNAALSDKSESEKNQSESPTQEKEQVQ